MAIQCKKCGSGMTGWALKCPTCGASTLGEPLAEPARATIAPVAGIPGLSSQTTTASEEASASLPHPKPISRRLLDTSELEAQQRRRAFPFLTLLYTVSALACFFAAGALWHEWQSTPAAPANDRPDLVQDRVVEKWNEAVGKMYTAPELSADGQQPGTARQSSVRVRNVEVDDVASNDVTTRVKLKVTVESLDGADIRTDEVRLLLVDGKWQLEMAGAP